MSKKQQTDAKNKGFKAGGGMERVKKAPGAVIDDGSMYNDPSALNEGDPNYEDPNEEDKGEYFNTIYQFQDCRSDVGTSKMTLTAYKGAVEAIIKEYFTSGDLENLLERVNELATPSYGYELVKRSINMSLDQADRERELVSRLLSRAYPDALSSSMIGKGFERLFELVDEIEKDCPQAREMLTTFLARAVVDEVVPPSFLSDPVVCNLGGEVVEHAKRMLSRDHAGTQLERIWGPGDGRPVSDLKVATDQLLGEYLTSSLVDEAARCIKELSAPYFHHEIVKRAIKISLDRSEDLQIKMSGLLAYLVREEVVSQTQCIKGFRRVYGIMSDLKLDTPAAHALVNAFTERALADGVLPKQYQQLLEI